MSYICAYDHISAKCCGIAVSVLDEQVSEGTLASKRCMVERTNRSSSPRSMYIQTHPSSILASMRCSLSVPRHFAFVDVHVWIRSTPRYVSESLQRLFHTHSLNVILEDLDHLILLQHASRAAFLPNRSGPCWRCSPSQAGMNSHTWYHGEAARKASRTTCGVIGKY